MKLEPIAQQGRHNASLVGDQALQIGEAAVRRMDTETWLRLEAAVRMYQFHDFWVYEIKRELGIESDAA